MGLTISRLLQQHEFATGSRNDDASKLNEADMLRDAISKFKTVGEVVSEITKAGNDKHSVFITRNGSRTIPACAQNLLAAAYIRETSGEAFNSNGELDFDSFNETMEAAGYADIVDQLDRQYLETICLSKDMKTVFFTDATGKCNITVQFDNFVPVLPKFDGPTEIEQRAVKKIGRAFAQYKVKVNQSHLVDFNARRIIRQIEQTLIEHVSSSGWATIQNGLPFNFLELYREQLNQADEHAVILFHVAMTGKIKLTKDILVNHLSVLYRLKHFNCQEFAYFLAIMIREEKALPQKVRDEVKICSTIEHTMCAIGGSVATIKGGDRLPRLAGDAIIVDPMVSFVNLPPTAQWRPTRSEWQSRQHGFFGHIEQYRTFVEAHPMFGSKAVFFVQTVLTTLIKSVTLEDIKQCVKSQLRSR